MQVFIPQKLSVVSAAGNAIPEGTTGAVNILLPFGSSQNQTVTIRARDFGGSVPVRVVLTPDNGTPLTYDTTIDNTATNPAEATVNVVMPINRLVRVSAWTRCNVWRISLHHPRSASPGCTLVPLRWHRISMTRYPMNSGWAKTHEALARCACLRVVGQRER